MSQLPARLYSGAGKSGGVVGYPVDRIHEEVAFIAFHFHWPPERLMQMEHGERRQWVEQVSRINRALSGN
ncbi:DUF6760 family protein [Herbaspirillum rhizosphaerae]|uniref:DUF6760 family protein n=1 Tax=Herbaspirillum rhizosphaerae TaxID=346179 RepID=UPI0023E45186|nr:DUF6760 family protein [Herbaspirillum rhizosphaerae]